MSVILLTSSKSKYWWQTSFSLLVRRHRRCEFICTPLEPFKRSSPLVARARVCVCVCMCFLSLSLSLSLLSSVSLSRGYVREKSEKKKRRRETEPLARATRLLDGTTGASAERNFISAHINFNDAEDGRHKAQLEITNIMTSTSSQNSMFFIL